MVNGVNITTNEPINDDWQGCTDHYNNDWEETDEFQMLHKQIQRSDVEESNDACDQMNQEIMHLHNISHCDEEANEKKITRRK